MSERIRNVAVWMTEDEAAFVREQIENEFGERRTNGIADGRAVVELIGRLPSFKRGGS